MHLTSLAAACRSCSIDASFLRYAVSWRSDYAAAVTIEPLDQGIQFVVGQGFRPVIPSCLRIWKIELPEPLRQLATRSAEVPEAVGNQDITAVEVGLHFGRFRVQVRRRVFSASRSQKRIELVDVVRCTGLSGFLMVEFSALSVFFHGQHPPDPHDIGNALVVWGWPEANDPVARTCSAPDSRLADAQRADVPVHIWSVASVFRYDVAIYSVHLAQPPLM